MLLLRISDSDFIFVLQRVARGGVDPHVIIMEMHLDRIIRMTSGQKLPGTYILNSERSFWNRFILVTLAKVAYNSGCG